MSIYLRNFIRFFILVLIQVLVLNNLHLAWGGEGSILPPYTPFIYPLILLLLPLSTPTWLMMILGFFTGLTIDMFMNTGGIHAAVCVLVSVLRTGILTALLPKRLSEYPNLSPGIKNMGWMPFITYCAIVLLIHHFVFYLIEIWSVKNIFYILMKTLVSFITSLVFVMIWAFFFGTGTGQNTLNE